MTTHTRCKIPRLHDFERIIVAKEERITVAAGYKETYTMPNFASDTPLVGTCQCEIESRPASCESITLTQDRDPIDKPNGEDRREFTVEVTPDV